MQATRSLRRSTPRGERLIESALFAAAEAWLRGKGCRTAMGPVHLSTNEEVGLLVEGHAEPPMFMMSHDPPHTPGRIEGAGYARAKDIYAYVCSVADDLPAPIVLSAWGAQLEVDELPAPEADEFIRAYRQAASAPEPGAPCTGGAPG